MNAGWRAHLFDWQPGTARRLIADWCAGVALLVAALFAFSATTRLAARTLFLLPSFFAQLPGSPETLISPAPVRTVVDLPPVDGFVRAHVYAPPRGRHPALVISLGIGPAPPDDPRVVRLLDGFARDGLVAILVQSEALDNDTLAPDLPRALVEAVQYAATRPDVRADAIGLFGFSVGGSLAIAAAADPAIAGTLRAVDAFGAYARLDDAIVSIASRTMVESGRILPWMPDDRSVEHLVNALTGALPDQTEAEALRRAILDSAPLGRDPSTLSAQGRAILALMNARGDPAAARRALAGLPSVFAADDAALSPLALLGRVRAPLFVMYDRDDPLLPPEGSRQICAAARDAGLQPYCSAFSIFKHVEPGHLTNPLTLSRDLIALFLHTVAVLNRLR